MTDIAAVQIAWLHTWSFMHYLNTHLVHIDKPDISHDLDITFTFVLSGIHAVKHNLNSCQPPYPIMYQSFAMEAQADAAP